MCVILEFVCRDGDVDDGQVARRLLTVCKHTHDTHLHLNRVANGSNGRTY